MVLANQKAKLTGPDQGNLSIRLYFTNNSLTQTLMRSLSAHSNLSLYLVSNQNVAGEI
jgi:hypothetical protein